MQESLNWEGYMLVTNGYTHRTGKCCIRAASVICVTFWLFLVNVYSVAIHGYRALEFFDDGNAHLGSEIVREIQQRCFGTTISRSITCITSGQHQRVGVKYMRRVCRTAIFMSLVVKFLPKERCITWLALHASEIKARFTTEGQ